MSVTYGYSNVERLLANLLIEEQRYNAFLKEHLTNVITDAHEAPTIDEFALLVPDRAHLARLDSVLREMGWTHFNSATDNVRTAPIRSGYSVEYFFYRHPRFSWRLEVMMLGTGVSPLHAAIPPALPKAMATPVHASFKCADEMTYAIARHVLSNSGLALAQQCDSTYGRFSYYASLVDRSAHVPYLKPRVNTRDA